MGAEMDLCHIYVSIICIFIITEATLSASDLRGQFSLAGENTISVRENMILEIFCPKKSEGTVSITVIKRKPKRSVSLIRDFLPVDPSSKYNFSNYTLTIDRIGRDDGGIYQCIQAGFYVQSCTVDVFFSPQESPLCSTKHKSALIFYDEIKESFIFNCSTETAYPPVEIELLVNKKVVPNITKFPHDRITTVSISSYVNETSNDDIYWCNVTQQLPFPHSGERYEGSCSFGPLQILPVFSVTVLPSIVYVRKGDNVTFTCSSNVSEVETKWIKIPGTNYTIDEYNEGSELTIILPKLLSTDTIFVKCLGSYYGRNVIGHAVMNIEKAKTLKDTGVSGKLPEFIMAILFGILLVVIFLVIIKVTQTVSRRRSISLNSKCILNRLTVEASPTENELNANKGNNVDPRNLSTTEYKNTLGDEHISVNNPAYETFTTTQNSREH